MAFPTPGADNNQWGADLNSLLGVGLNDDGSFKTVAVTDAYELQAGTNITIDSTDPSAPVINGSDSEVSVLTCTYNNGSITGIQIPCFVKPGFDPTVGGTALGILTIGNADGNMPSGTLPYGEGALNDGDYGGLFVFDVQSDVLNLQHILLQTIWTEDLLLSLAYDYDGQPLAQQWGNNESDQFSYLNPDGTIYVDAYGTVVQLDTSGNFDISLGDNGEWAFQAEDGRLSHTAGQSIYTRGTFNELLTGGEDSSPVGSNGDVAIVVNGGGPFFAIATEGTWLPYPYNIGWINTAIVRTLEDSSQQTLAQVSVSPLITGEGPPAGYITQFPVAATDMSPFNAILSSDIGIYIVVNPALEPNLWDTVDIGGTITMWDASGSNVLTATLSATGFNNGSEPENVTLEPIQIIGSDLSISEGEQILSAAGGSYSVLLQVEATWD